MDEKTAAVLESLQDHPGSTLDDLAERTKIDKEELAFVVGWLCGRNFARSDQWAGTNRKGKMCHRYYANGGSPS